MKNFLFLSLFIISACGQNSSVNSAKKDVAKSEDIVEIEPLTVTTPGTGIIPASGMDFGSLAVGSKATQDLIISNTSATLAVVYSASDFDSALIAPFTIKSNGCVGTLLARKRCTISFEVLNNNTLTSEQTLSSLFKVKGVDVSLTGAFQAFVDTSSNPVVAISVSPLALNFGSFNVGEFKELTIIVRNNDTTRAQAVSLTAISNLRVTISSNTCPASLASRANCSVKLKYTGVSAEVKSLENLLKIANYQITHSATVISPSVEEPQVLSIVPETLSRSISLNQPSTQAGTIRFTNTGTVSLPSPVSAVSSNPGVQIGSVSCSSGLSRSKTCDVNYVVSGPSGISNQTIRLQSGTNASSNFNLVLNIVPNGVPCTIADAQANGVNPLNSNSLVSGLKISSDVSQCLLASNACNQYFSISTDSKSCQAVSSACLPSDAQANGWNISQALTVSGSRAGGDISSCVVATCNPNYEITGKDCTAISCTQANSEIANVLTVTGTKVSGCSADTCLNEFEKVGNTCSAVSCTLANAQGNGITSILNVATVAGSITDDSCLVGSCDQYYKNAVDNKSCFPKLCTDLNAGELTSLGYNLTDATISGTYDSCSVTCTNPQKELALDGKSCVDLMPSGSVTFVNDYTKVLEQNEVQITSSNAQVLRFFSDSQCSNVVGSDISLPASSLNLDLSSGDGEKHLYAKFINGTQSTACLSDSIILDQTDPIISITAPILSSSIAGASLVVSGTCSDVSSTVSLQIDITPGSESQGVECSGGTFSALFNIGALPEGLKSISISGQDLATNTGSTASSFNRLICSSFQDTVGNECIDKDPSGTISFDKDFTKNLDQNLINITSTNGQEIQFYSDASCSTPEGSVLALPLSSPNLTLSPGDGVKNVYAKIINGSKSSACLTDNLILDQTSPDLAVTAPALNADIAGNSLIISGTCSELNAPTVSVGVTLNGVTRTQACASGLFSSTFDITSVPVSSQTISLSATDLAGNIGTASSTFNRINCTALQTLAGNSCTDNDPTGTILFAADYTKVLSPNIVNITSTNGQSIQFYSDASCLTTAGVALALPLASTNLTLSPTDGVKNAYAKILNGSKSSSCLTDNIILDQTLPVLAVTSPVLNANIAGNSLVITGTCSELNLPTVSVGVTLNGVTQNQACASGLFTSTFNITAVPVASQTISVSATDLALNTRTITSTFNRINCNAFQTLVGNSCVDNITFTPVYSVVYSACSASLPCSGVGSQSAPIVSCQKFVGGNPVAGGVLSDCSSFSQTTSQSCNSPSGTFVDEILGGSLNYNCGEGQTTLGITPTVICDSGYTADQQNQICNALPVAATEGYLIFASTSGIRRSTYDKATNTIVAASTITLNTFFNNVASSSVGYSNGDVYIGSNLAGNSTRLQRVPIAGGSMTVVKDYPTNFSNASIHDLINCNNKLYYRAPISAASSVFGLYMFDTTQPISGSNPSTTVITNNVNKISCVANKLYYIGPQDSNTRGIFVIDTATNVKTFITTGRTGSLVGNTLDQYEQLVFGKDHFYYLPTINDSLTLNVKKVRLSDNVLVQTINTTTVGGIQGQYFYLSIGVDKSNDDLYLAEADLGVSTTRIKKYNGVSNSYVGSAISGVLADFQPEIMVSADYITWRHGGGGSTVSNLTKNGATVTNNSSSKVRRYRMYDGYYFMNLAGSSSSSNFDNTVRGASANTMSSLISNLGDFDIVDKP